MTARGTDWSLALVVAVLVVSGLGTWFAGGEGSAWVFAAHGIAGGALAFLVGWKLRRVWRRLVERARRDSRTVFGALALLLVAATLLSGWLWSSAGRLDLAGYSVLVWHGALGAVLAAMVLVHLSMRAKRPRWRDVTDRRQFLQLGGIAAAGFAIWWVQRPLAAVLGAPGAERRFTGSYEQGSFAANSFPSTSWVSDSPRELGAADWRLRVDGAVAGPLELGLADVDAGDELTATLDCTGGFYSSHEWQGISLRRLLERAGVDPDARHLSVVSRTGYRWSFDRDDAEGFLLATRVDGEPLDHGHGAPARLVAPQRRGLQWVKWVEAIELSTEPDHAAPASTIWSSFTATGRGAA